MRILVIVLFLSLMLGGCEMAQKAATGKADQKVSGETPTKPVNQTKTDTDDEGGKGGNALTQSEDDASRERRMKARQSLGLGGK